MQLNPIYVLCSDDPLLKNDRSKEIIEFAKTRGQNPEFLLFTYTDFASTGGKSNLQVLENELLDPGFFCDFRIIKIYLKDLDKTACDVLNSVARFVRSGLVVIVDLPRVNTTYTKVAPKQFEVTKADDSTKTKTKGKRSPGLETQKKNAMAYVLGANGSIESFYPPDPSQMSMWIINRASKYGFRLDRQSAQYLATSCEGNLVSIDQSLQIMRLTSSENTINTQMVDFYFSQDARFSGFELPEALFSGNTQRALNIIDSVLNSQGQNKTATLGLFISTLDNALNALCLYIQGGFASKALNEKKAFFLSRKIKVPSMQNAIMKATSILNLEQIFNLIKECAKANVAYSHFDNTKALLTLQRMCLSVNYRVLPLCQGLQE